MAPNHLVAPLQLQGLGHARSLQQLFQLIWASLSSILAETWWLLCDSIQQLRTTAFRWQPSTSPLSELAHIHAALAGLILAVLLFATVMCLHFGTVCKWRRQFPQRTQSISPTASNWTTTRFSSATPSSASAVPRLELASWGAETIASLPACQYLVRPHVEALHGIIAALNEQLMKMEEHMKDKDAKIEMIETMVQAHGWDAVCSTLKSLVPVVETSSQSG